MEFEGDAFISYAHLDNLELIEGQKGWVSNLHRALEVRVAQLLGKEPHIFRDPKLKGNDAFADTLFHKLQRVAALVPVISPRYVKSDWTRKELSEFWRAAKEHGDGKLNEKVRIFKVLKTPVPLAMHPPELQHVLGYEFYKIDPETGRIHELDAIFGPEAQRDFWLKLDDLAHDICCLLETIEQPDTAPSPVLSGKAVFLAESTSDVREQRETIRRDLQQHGYTVLPARPLPSALAEMRTAVQDDLARSLLSIHLLGKNFGLVPDGGTESLMEIQNDLAIERGKKGAFTRLLWIPPGLEIQDERQRRVIEHVRNDPRMLDEADLLETFLEDFRTVVHAKLNQSAKISQSPKINNLSPNPPLELSQIPVSSPAANPDILRIYAIYDQRDVEVAHPWVDFLFDQRFEVLQPLFEGDEAEIREYHEDNLRSCDGALIFYGSGNECWLRRKLREIQKSPGYQRTKPLPTIAISLITPKTPDKERFRTHEAFVIPQFDGFSPDPLSQFLAGLQR